MDRLFGQWHHHGSYAGRAYVCGYCGQRVSADHGYHIQNKGNEGPDLRICPHCNRPTYFEDISGTQIPGPAYGALVEHLPVQVEEVYEEARRCMSADAFTAAALLLRKLLMNVAVAQGAAGNQTFASYVSYLADNGYVPPNGRAWVDHIRDKGNEATHELPQINRQDAVDLLNFAEMLLKFVFEFPNRLPSAGSL